jgi:hypothetical protein
MKQIFTQQFDDKRDNQNEDIRRRPISAEVGLVRLVSTF